MRDGRGPSACAATSAAAWTTACAAACTAPDAGSSSSSMVVVDDHDINEDAGVASATSQIAAELSLVAAGVDEDDDEPRPSRGGGGGRWRVANRAERRGLGELSCLESFFLGLAATVCQRAAERSQACAASPVGRRNAGWSRDHPARRFGSSEQQASGLRRVVGPERRRDERAVRHERKLVDGPIGLRALLLWPMAYDAPGGGMYV